jgi:Na+/H+ antiporter NhaD/arsenite permease-like protein
MIFGIPLEFVFFGVTLLGVALFHHHTLYVALVGMATIALYKVGIAGFTEAAGINGLLAHFAHEWVTLANLLGLLVGFTLLSDHFEKSQVPDILPRFLPDDWKGGFVLLVLVFVLSSFLDNIAAALIGATIAKTVFRHKVHIGYLAAIVAASNAGGSGSVVGDTTTTMMWLAGISPVAVFPAYIAAIVALVVCGIPAALQQHKHQPILKDERPGIRIEWPRLGIVAFILIAAIAMNVYANQSMGSLASAFPWLGCAVWVAILLSITLRAPNWALVPNAAKGALFLLSLVFAASMMPVDKLPAASWQSAFALGFVSAVFDNIPLTALAIKQGGFDWGVLAYSVGFGGSMLWFGSSAGVAVSGLFEGAKSASAWLRGGWHVVLAYVVGFFVMLALWGWHPTAQNTKSTKSGAVHPAQLQVADQSKNVMGDTNGRYFITTQT